MTRFQHSDDWRRDIQQQINEIRTFLDMVLLRVSTLESQQSALSHKVHTMKYAEADE